MQSVTEKGETVAHSTKNSGDNFTDQKLTGGNKNLPAAHCGKCARAGFRPVIIPPEPEDPRDVAIRSLLAIKEHDRNIGPGDNLTLDDAIRFCRRSLFKDNARGIQG